MTSCRRWLTVLKRQIKEKTGFELITPNDFTHKIPGLDMLTEHKASFYLVFNSVFNLFLKNFRCHRRKLSLHIS